MTRRLLVVHRTGFRYESPVRASYNEARMTPLTTATQTALDARLEVSPVTWRHSYRDYWGSQVTAFDVLVPHDELMVVSSSTVEVMGAPERTSPPLSWQELRRDDVRDPYTEYLAQSTWTVPAGEVIALAHEAAADLGPDGAARAVCGAVFDALDYVPGSTSVQTTAAQVWQARKGVCQDFAHLTLGALRELGIPARYVSGHLHPVPDAAIGETVEGQSHAWVEWWAGEWVAFDPTHDVPAGTDHVVVARGRDYSDVTPLKGVYAGTAGSLLFVAVDVTRLA
jgi:transglutaminase-like putative cysteine protease